MTYNLLSQTGVKHCSTCFYSDVVYDCEIVEALVRVFHHVLHEDNVAYVASTIRNDDTRQFFLKALG